MSGVDATHDPSLRTWVAGADGGDFPIQNLPFGVFRRRGSRRAAVGVAIGDAVLDIGQLLSAGRFKGDAVDAAELCRGGRLDRLMSAGRAPARALRLALSRLLRAGAVDRRKTASCLAPRGEVTMQLPAPIGGFTDFFTSIHHARNASRIFDPNRPELPNFRSLPIAYNGRASTVVVSGTDCPRPKGQTGEGCAAAADFGASRWLDFELEVGAWVGTGVPRGHPLPIETAEQHLFGLCLVNDWSARDIQAWESAPLGPFLGKSFMTTVSPWVVTLDALEPFRCPAAPREKGDPPLLPYLHAVRDRTGGAVDIRLEASLRSAAMAAAHLPAVTLARPLFREQYWTLAQMITHHTSNGCSLRTGDLLASGTVSGPGEPGCLLELTELGRRPMALPGDERRAFLEDGDEIVMRGTCSQGDYVPIGFGPCTGRVLAAPS